MGNKMMQERESVRLERGDVIRVMMAKSPWIIIMNGYL